MRSKSFARWALATVALFGGPQAIGATPHVVRAHLMPGGSAAADPAVGGILSKLIGFYGQEAARSNVYVGSEVCLVCHDNPVAFDMTPWRGTQHAAAYIRPMPQFTLVPGKGVLANTLAKPSDDFLEGLDFNAISSPFDPYKPNAPKLSVKKGAYTITIGQLDLPVVFMLQWRFPSGVWEELFCVRVPVSDSPSGLTGAVYSSPLFFASDTGWQAYTPEAWWDESNAPRYGTGATTATVVANCESHDQNCVGCHATGTRSITQNARGEWVWEGFKAVIAPPGDPGTFDYSGDGTPTLMNIGCESCHGPGSKHVESLGDPALIVNPGKLDTQGANDVCGQCHSVVASTPTGVIGWPYDEIAQKSWIPGSASLADFFTDTEVWWPDGKTGEDTSQYPEFYKSAKPTFQFHPVRCTDCHDPHRPTSNPAQVVEAISSGGLTVPTHVNDDTLCLACHATHGGGTSADFSKITVAMVADYAGNRDAIADVVGAHTHHPYAPERIMGLSRCTECHMAKTQGPDASLSLHGHTFEAISPQKTLLYQAQGGMPNSCALSCHATLVNASLVGSVSPGISPDISTWDKQYDQDLANALLYYYGPNGVWWKADAGTAGASALAATSSSSTPTTTRGHPGVGRRSHR